MLWISLLLSNKAITTESHIFLKKKREKMFICMNISMQLIQNLLSVLCVREFLASPYMCSWELYQLKINENAINN